MQWENMSWRELKEACAQCGGVCIVSVGTVEPHGEALPLGTDYLTAHKIAVEAAAKEQVVTFPPLYLSSVYESASLCGTVTIKPELLVQLYFNIFDEISRNGFKKIIVSNGHGGNDPFLRFLGFSALSQRRDYQLHFINGFAFTEEQKRIIEADCEGRARGHACEYETSLMLWCSPEHVHMDRIPGETVDLLRRRKLDDIGFDGIRWYSICPDCYCGNANYATLERGEKYAGFAIENLIKLIRAVKQDTLSREMYDEFYEKSNM